MHDRDQLGARTLPRPVDRRLGGGSNSSRQSRARALMLSKLDTLDDAKVASSGSVRGAREAELGRKLSGPKTKTRAL